MITTNRVANMNTCEAVARGYERNGEFYAVLVTRDGSHYRLAVDGNGTGEEEADQIIATWIARGDRVVGNTSL
jgi:hypothetical protein